MHGTRKSTHFLKYLPSCLGTSLSMAMLVLMIKVGKVQFSIPWLVQRSDATIVVYGKVIAIGVFLGFLIKLAFRSNRLLEVLYVSGCLGLSLGFFISRIRHPRNDDINDIHYLRDQALPFSYLLAFVTALVSLFLYILWQRNRIKNKHKEDSFSHSI